MNEQPTWQGENTVATTAITASSFKALTARLKKPGIVPATVPSFAPIVEQKAEAQIAQGFEAPAQVAAPIVGMSAAPPISDTTTIIESKPVTAAVQQPTQFDLSSAARAAENQKTEAVFGVNRQTPVPAASVIDSRDSEFEPSILEQLVPAEAPQSLAPVGFDEPVQSAPPIIEAVAPSVQSGWADETVAPPVGFDAPTPEPVTAVETVALPQQTSWIDQPAPPVGFDQAPFVEEVTVAPEDRLLETVVVHAPTVETIDAPAVEPEVTAVPGTSELLKRGAAFAQLELITRMVYAKPTAEERSQFLRDAAELIAAEKAARETAVQAAFHDAPVEEASEAFLADSEVAPGFLDEVAPAAEGDVPFLSDDLASNYKEPTISPVPSSAHADTFIADSDLVQQPGATPSGLADADVGETARTLLDMMASSTNGGLPHERALAADTLLRLYPQIPLKPLVMMAERLSIMDNPPHLLLGKTIRDERIEVAGPIIETCAHVTDHDLISVVEERNPAKLRLLARRRKLPRTISDQLVKVDDDSVHLTLVRNASAEISHGGFLALTDAARTNPDLLAPLATRGDLSPPFAFELFWLAPPQLRRYILGRFLTDSETLNKILKITMASQGSEDIPADNNPVVGQVLEALKLALAGRSREAAEMMAPPVRISVAAAERILADNQGEAFAVLLKAVGVPRAEAQEQFNALQKGSFNLVVQGRDMSEVFAIFETLSFNKARILLTYWDWAATRSGPYAPVH